MLRIPRRAPLLIAALLKQPCCQAFALFTAAGDLPSNNNDGCVQQHQQQQQQRRELAAGWTMAPKRGHWQRKKEERSRSFAKRGRVGGFGAYGHQAGGGATIEPSTAQDTAAAAATAGADNSNKGPGNAKRPGGNHRGTRRVETVHDGSYAGELGALLSEERRQLLKERFEQDDKKAVEHKEKEEQDNRQAAAPPTAEGASAETEIKTDIATGGPVVGPSPGRTATAATPAASAETEIKTEIATGGPVVGPNGEGGVASSTSKKKVALLISYWGSDYQGLQMNKGARTVEAELEMALYLAGAISKDNFGNPRKIGWARSGRTDKGVHAAAQVISLKLTYPNDFEKETVEAINSYLPKDIRAIDIKRAPKSFDSRTRCSGRRYEYIMPTYVLAPKEHIAALFEEALEWEKSQEAGGDGSSAVDADKDNAPAGLESAASGGGGLGGDASAQAAAAGTEDVAAGSPSEASSVTAADASAGTAMETGAATAPSDATGAGQEHPSAGAPGMGGSDNDGGGDDADDDCDGSQQAEEEEEDEGKAARLRLANIELSSPAVVRRVAEKLQGYRLPPDRVEELRETLKGFLGTKNYHNYTNHKQAMDPSCKRLITSFTAADPFEDDGMEWVRLTVVGQSFIMHQIRKMVASTVDRVRGQSNKEDFTKSFFEVKMSLGIAPSDGLYLERPLYSPYNAHVKRSGAEDRALEWESGPAAEILEEFKKNSIHAGILAKEKEYNDFVAWLDRITRYPCNY